MRACAKIRSWRIFHVCVIDGVFDLAEDGGVHFFEVNGLDAGDAETVQAMVRRRILRAFVRRGLVDKDDRKEMEQWNHGGGFSLDATARVEAQDRCGLERLLRYCARPPFAAERLEELDRHRLIYHLPKPGADGRTELLLSPLELIGRIAALVPPPRQHRHRYYGVLAPNAPLRAAVTALASQAAPVVQPPGALVVNDDPAEPVRRSPARYLWAMLLARLFETFPLACPRCGAEMRLIAAITETAVVRQILEHIGEPASPPRIAQARGPPEWEGEEPVAKASGRPPVRAFDHRVSD